MIVRDHRDKALLILSKGRLSSRTGLLHKTWARTVELDAVLEGLTKDGLVRTETDTGQKGAPKTWLLELVR
jgi:hypothetical protein